MSNFRERAAEVKAAGEATRGDFTPHGVPLRMYQWWLNESPGKKAEAIKSGARRENFCHFWRVVVFWTPLLWLLLVVLSGFEWVADRVTPKQGLIAAGVLVVAAIAAVVTFAGDWSEFLTFMGGGLLVTAVAVGIIAAVFWVCDRYEPAFPILVGTIFAGIAGWFTYLGFLEVGFWVFAIIAGIAAAVALIIGAAVLIGTWVEAWRADVNAKRRAAEDEAWTKYFDGEGPDPSKSEPREPGKVAKFFSGIGDFLVLATQVVRVNKWKICPLVDVDQNGLTEAK